MLNLNQIKEHIKEKDALSMGYVYTAARVLNPNNVWTLE